MPTFPLTKQIGLSGISSFRVRLCGFMETCGFPQTEALCCVLSSLWNESVTKQVPFHHSHEISDQFVAPEIALSATVNICCAERCTIPKTPDNFLFSSFAHD